MLTHFDFHLNTFLSHCVLNVISRCKFCKNGFFNTFFPLSHTFYFETRPVLSQKSEKMRLVRTSCSSTAKTSTVSPIFYFMILIKTVLPFDEKKIGTNLCSVFWQFYSIVRIEPSRVEKCASNLILLWSVK